jgi:hypothetical protein
VAIDVADVRKLSQLTPFAWSRYRLDRARGRRRLSSRPSGRRHGRAVGNVGWDGTERVSFRMHIPSEILYHNTPGVQRGNIPGVGSAADGAAARARRSICR